MTWTMLLEPTGSMKISDSLRTKLQQDRRPLYVIATASGFHPSYLSRIFNGAEVKRSHDIRFRLLANLVGYSGDIDL